MRTFPTVTCLCPTYGRFELLRDAVACFLSQTYMHKKLLILEDQPEPLVLGLTCPPSISVVRAVPRMPTLGDKRQALLELSDTPAVAHWDDDDLYMPGHLSFCIQLLRGGVECVKPVSAYYCVGPRGGFRSKGIRRNRFEGQMVFKRSAALAAGGYPPVDSGQCVPLLRHFRSNGTLVTPDSGPTYVYRWGQGCQHVSATKAPTEDNDFGGGRPLIPEGVDPFLWARERVGEQYLKVVGEDTE